MSQDRFPRLTSSRWAHHSFLANLANLANLAKVLRLVGAFGLFGVALAVATPFALVGCVAAPQEDGQGDDTEEGTSEENYTQVPRLRWSVPSTDIEAGACRFDTEGPWYAPSCPDCATEPHYDEAQAWTEFVLGNPKAKVHKAAKPYLEAMVRCLDRGDIQVTNCGNPVPAVAGGPPVSWLRYEGQCKTNLKGKPTLTAGTLLRMATEAFQQANASARPKAKEMGPLVSWTTLSGTCRVEEKVCQYPVTATPEVSGYLDPSPAYTRALLGTTSTTAQGTRNSTPVTIFLWTAEYKACRSDMAAAAPCSVSGFPASAPPAPATEVRGYIAKSGSKCKCIQ
jgi:hypothetical protein